MSLGGRDSDAYRDLLDHAARGESEPLRAAVWDAGASLERRQFAIGTLGRMRAKEAIPDLIRALGTDDDPLLRAEAAAALIWFKDPRVRINVGEQLAVARAAEIAQFEGGAPELAHPDIERPLVSVLRVAIGLMPAVVFNGAMVLA